jgi:ATP-binding cassette subfamily F protein uup
LLKLLTGEIQPDEGTVTLAPTLDGIVIDQQRSLLAPDKSVRDILADGGDWVEVRGVKSIFRAISRISSSIPQLVEASVGALLAANARASFSRVRPRIESQSSSTNQPTIWTLKRSICFRSLADYEGTVAARQPRPRLLDRTVTVTLGLDGRAR